MWPALRRYHLNMFNGVVRREVPPFFFPRGETQLDGIRDVLERLLAGVAGGDATRDNRDLGRVPAVLIYRQQHGELDGLIAHLYGLTEEEFAHILTTFPLVPETDKKAALEAFKAFAPKSADAQLAADIAAGESAGLEFKSSARWDFKENRVNKVLEQVILKTNAGFLNTDGGTLLIGLDDAGNVVGLEHDYETFGRKQPRDAYENWLTTLLLGEFGRDKAPLFRISFSESEGKDVCRVTSKPSPNPVYVKEGNSMNLYIRAGNSTRQLTTKEAVDYCRHHWPS